jgi:hypothetical protein
MEIYGSRGQIDIVLGIAANLRSGRSRGKDSRRVMLRAVTRRLISRSVLNETNRARS